MAEGHIFPSFVKQERDIFEVQTSLSVFDNGGGVKGEIGGGRRVGEFLKREEGDIQMRFRFRSISGVNKITRREESQ